VLALPLTSATRGLIGARELALMKSTACLINVARAELVDEAALYEALSQRRIAGAALDVWYRYPSGVSKNQPALPASHPFHMLENVIITPHSSGNTDETFRLRAEDAVENIRRLITGEELQNVVLASSSAALERSDGNMTS
jgi:phosphoglycerate dehydrogenase-like enzyme